MGKKSKRKTNWNVCNMFFGKSCRDESMNLTLIYITNRNKLTNHFPDFSIEIVSDFGGDSETVVLKAGQIIPIRVASTGNDYEVTNLYRPNTRNSERIVLKAPRLPFSVKKSSTEVLSLTATDVWKKESVVFPLVLEVVDKKTSKSVMVLKELHIYLWEENLELLRNLVPKCKYTKPKKYYVDYGKVEIVEGKPPEREYYIPYKIPLEEYKMPDSLLRLLNSGLKLPRDCCEEDKEELDKIEDLLTSKALTPANYNDMLNFLLYLEEHQLMKDIRAFDMKNQEFRRISPTILELDVPGLMEQRPSLIKGDPVIVKENDKSLIGYEGIVHKVYQKSVHLGFNKTFVAEVYKPKKGFSVSFTYNRYAIRVEHQAVNFIGLHRVARIFFPENIRGVSSGQYSYDWFNKEINLEQKQAVEHIVENTSIPAPYLLFGPPGTGKTMTVIEAIYQVWKLKPSSRILVCAPSNNAANEVAKRLIVIPRKEKLRYFAISVPYENIPKEIKEFSNHDSSGTYYCPNIDEFKSYRVVVTTICSAARLVNVGVPSHHFDYVFIDESGHATEPQTLIPIAGILTSGINKGRFKGQVVMAGDPKQLGPIVHSQKAKDLGLDISMLERLMKSFELYQKQKDGKYNSKVLTKLVQNYRSHPKILKLPNELFYDGELVPKAKESIVNLALDWEYLPNGKFPMIFHSVDGLEQQELNSPSFCNILELGYVLHYLEKLIGTNLKGEIVTERDIAVITPYSRQVQKLKVMCDFKKWKDLTVGSLEQLQGQERLIVIISTVRSRSDFIEEDPNSHLGFLTNEKRFNVAVTRAKALLIVIGNADILKFDKNWKKLINYCIENGGFRGEMPITPDDIYNKENPLETFEQLTIEDSGFEEK